MHRMVVTDRVELQPATVVNLLCPGSPTMRGPTTGKAQSSAILVSFRELATLDALQAEHRIVNYRVKRDGILGLTCQRRVFVHRLAVFSFLVFQPPSLSRRLQLLLSDFGCPNSDPRFGTLLGTSIRAPRFGLVTALSCRVRRSAAKRLLWKRDRTLVFASGNGVLD